MKRRVLLLTSALSITLLFTIVLAGCGGNARFLSTSGNQSLPLPQPAANPTIVMNQSPSHLGAGETYQFTATVSDASDTSVLWRLEPCDACGTISEGGLYTAPAFVSGETYVIVVATARANSSLTASTALWLRPISVSLEPATPANVPPGGTRSFAAVLDHDRNHAGVTWTLAGAGCSGEACGTLTDVTATSAVYQAPPAAPVPPAITLTATSVTDSSRSAVAFFTSSSAALQISGPYAFLINGYRDGVLVAVAGHLQAEPGGTFTGVWDANRGAAPEIAQPISGTYSLQPDGNGTLTIHDGNATAHYVLSFNSSATSGRFIEVRTPSDMTSATVSGYLLKQDSSYFNAAALQGDRVIALYGEATGSHCAALGRFTTGPGGVLSSGAMDLTWAINENTGGFFNQVALSGTFGAPDAVSGRGVGVLHVASGAAADYHFAYYIVSDEQALLVETDGRGFNAGLLIPTLSGKVVPQKHAGAFSTASLNAPLVFGTTDAADYDWMTPIARVRTGRMTPNGAGTLSIFYDQAWGGDWSTALRATGTYAVAANGRATWSVPEAAVAYLVDDNKGYFMTQDLDGAGFGAFEAQTGTPFSLASLAGTVLIHSGPPAAPDVESDAGWLTVADDGNASGILYINSWSGSNAFAVTGTMALVGTGHGTLKLQTEPATVPREIVFWLISPKRAVGVPFSGYGDGIPVLLQMEWK